MVEIPAERVSEEEAAALSRRREEAEAILALQGTPLQQEEARLFREMEAQRLTPSQRKAAIEAHFDKLLGEAR